MSLTHKNPFALIDPTPDVPVVSQTGAPESTKKKKKNRNSRRGSKDVRSDEGDQNLSDGAPEVWEEVPREALEEEWQEVTGKKAIKPQEPEPVVPLTKTHKKNLKKKAARAKNAASKEDESDDSDSETPTTNPEAAGFKIGTLNQTKLQDHQTPNTFAVLPTESPVMEKKPTTKAELEKKINDETRNAIDVAMVKEMEKRTAQEEMEAMRRAEIERREKEAAFLQAQLQAKRAEEYRLQQEMERQEAIRIQLENKRLEEAAIKKAQEDEVKRLQDEEQRQRQLQQPFQDEQFKLKQEEDALLNETFKNLTTNAPAIPTTVQRDNIPKGIYSPTTGRLNRGAFYKPGMVPGPPPGFASRPPPGFEKANPAGPAGVAVRPSGSFDSPSVSRAPPGFDTINTPSPSLTRRAPPGFDRRIAPPGFETAPRSPSFSPRSFTQYRTGSSLGPSSSSDGINGLKGRSGSIGIREPTLISEQS